MTDEELNKLIHEKMGLCWHDFLYHSVGSTWPGCIKCSSIVHRNYDFLNDWTDWGSVLLPWFWQQNFVPEFISWFYNKHPGNLSEEWILFLEKNFINPHTFCEALIEFWDRGVNDE